MVVRARTFTRRAEKTARLTAATAGGCGTVDGVRNDGGRATRAPWRGRLPLVLVIGLGVVLAGAAVAGGLELSLSTKPAASTTSAGHPAGTGGSGGPPGGTAQSGATPPQARSTPPAAQPPTPTTTTQPATAPAAPPGPAALPGVVDDCSGPGPTGTRTAVEPASIMIACADGGLRLEDLTWTSWTSTSAEGHGVLLANDCTPDCAQGTFHSFPGAFELSHPEPSSSGVVFSEVTATYTRTVPGDRTGGPVTHFTLEVPRAAVGS